MDPQRQTAPAFSAAPLRQALAAALTALLGDHAAGEPSAAPAGLVLLGDVLDFSLGTPERAIDDFGRLLKAFNDEGTRKHLGPVVVVPGNHDHALWTVARFQRMVGKNRREDDFHHITKAFDAPEDHPVAPIIDTVLAEHGFGPSALYYPNLGLTRGDRTVVLHHGHFVESTYRVMSNLVAQLAGQDPSDFDAETLEILNASWIDFLWSSDGDNGKLGRDIQVAYEYLLTGAADMHFDHRLAGLIAQKIATTVPLPKTAGTRKMVDTVTRALVEVLVGQYGQTERFSYDDALSADSRAGLRAYVQGPVLRQLAHENPGPAPREMTFIFGHTHKPFEDRLICDALPLPVHVYNTGGWDLDTPMFDTMLGAALVFVDDDLNVASLRVCDVPRQDGRKLDPDEAFRPHVATADGDIAGNPLAASLDRSLQVSRALWDAFAIEAEKAYRAKQAFTLADLARETRLNHKSGNVL